MFQETRESLAYIARFNGNKIDNNYIFSTEVETEKEKTKRLSSENGQEEIEDEDLDGGHQDEERASLIAQTEQNFDTVTIKQELTDGQLLSNLIKMTIMWTQASFNQFLLSAQMKYLEGNIFVNFYIFGAAGIAAVILGGYIYNCYGLRNSFAMSFFMCIIGCIGMLVIQLDLIQFANDAAREHFEEHAMPVLILILKMGIIMSFIITT